MTASNFDKALKAVLADEGGYSNHPSDPGGATNHGVIQKVYDGFRDGLGRSRQSVKKITMAEVRDIYRKQYADAIKFNDLPDGVDYCVFDGAVNSGPSQSVKWLQRALGGVNVDGQLGMATLAAVEKADTVRLVNSICDQRMAFLKRLRTWSVFGTGWTKRVKGVRALALAMAKGVKKLPKPVEQPAEASGKALPSDTKVTETPAGKEATRTVTVGGGGLLTWLLTQFETARDSIASFTGLSPDLVGKLLVGVTIGTLGIAVTIAAVKLIAIWRGRDGEDVASV